MRKIIFVLMYCSFTFAQVVGLSGWDIFLDPGHSQTENMGVNGYSEAEEVLRVGLQLQDLLLSQTDIDTVYISRTNDQQSVSLYQRTNHANNLGASWYHSIHSNAGASSNNNTLLLWGELYNGQPDPPIGGEEMSSYMIDLLTHGMRIPTIGSRGDCSFYSYSDYCANSGGPYLYVNRNTNMPSELSEEGHHSNPAQNQLYMNTEYKKLLAYTFYWSILKYHNIQRPIVGICTGKIRDSESEIPINGATVMINGQTFTTDTFESLFDNYSSDPDELHNGFFYLENLPNTTMELTVSADGYYADTLSVSIIDSFFTFQDIELLSSQAPIVINTNPEDGTIGFPAWDPIRLIFSRSMNSDSTESAISFSTNTPLSFNWSNSNKTVDIYPDSIMFETDIIVTVSPYARDIYGHGFDGNADGESGGIFELYYQSSASDIEAPYLEDIYPPSSSSFIEQYPVINITYNEQIANILTLSSLIELERFQTTESIPIFLQHYYIGEKSVISLFPENPLYPNEVFVTRISSGIMDYFGNTTTSYNNNSFQTGNTDWAITHIDNFDNGLMSNWWAPSNSGSTTGTLPAGTGMNGNSAIVNHNTSSTQSMEIQYNWNVSETDWLIREYLDGGAPRNVIFNDEYILQAYIFGDGNGTLFRFCVDDNVPQSDAGNHEVSPWVEVDWYGWKLISWNLAEDETGEWLGDGTLEGNLRFDSFQLSYAIDNPSNGLLIIDDLRLVQEFQLNIVENILVPKDYSLNQNFPNPFNAETTIEFSVPTSTFADIMIYNITGQHIRHLYQKNVPPGTYHMQWNGETDEGISVPSGVYFYTLSTDNAKLTRRMILLK